MYSDGSVSACRSKAYECISDCHAAFCRSCTATFVLLFLAGPAATGGQLSITKAYTKAPAKEISVFDYSQVIFAALLGFVFLQQIPDYLSVIGYVIIIGSAIFKWNYNLRYEEKV